MKNNLEKLAQENFLSEIDTQKIDTLVDKIFNVLLIFGSMGTIYIMARIIIGLSN